MTPYLSPDTLSFPACTTFDFTPATTVTTLHARQSESSEVKLKIVPAVGAVRLTVGPWPVGLDGRRACATDSELRLPPVDVHRLGRNRAARIGPQELELKGALHLEVRPVLCGVGERAIEPEQCRL